MTLGLNQEGTKRKCTYQSGFSIGVERQGQTMPLELIDLNSRPVVAVNCHNRKAMGKKKWDRMRLEKSTKNDNIEFRKKTITKWKSNFKSTKSQKVSSYYGKNWKVITIYLIITVIVEIIVNMIVMLMNKDNNK